MVYKLCIPSACTNIQKSFLDGKKRGNMATPTKGVYWVDKEVELMLKLLHDAGVGRRVMTSMHMETISIFEAVVAGLKSARFHCEPGQARSKFKHEKSAFFECMQAHDGRPPRRDRPPHFRLLKRLWEQAGRPHWTQRHPGSEC